MSSNLTKNAIPDYCQVVKVKGPNGTTKKRYFPKALDLHRPKRPRTTFTATQLLALECEFEKSFYLIGKDRRRLAEKLKLTETQIKVWYQNRRTKEKSMRENDLAINEQQNACHSNSASPPQSNPSSYQECVSPTDTRIFTNMFALSPIQPVNKLDELVKMISPPVYTIIPTLYDHIYHILK